MRPPRRLVSALSVALVGAVLLTGCTDDEDPAPTPSPSGAGTTSGMPTDEVSASSSSPAPTAATGRALKEETSQLNAPEGPWKPIDGVVTYSSAVGRDDTGEVIALSDRENFATPATLDEQVRVHDQSIGADAQVERRPDVVLDGEPAYLVVYRVKGDEKVAYDIGTQRDGRVIAVHFDLMADDPQAADAVVEAVVASFAWR